MDLNHREECDWENENFTSRESVKLQIERVENSRLSSEYKE